MVLKISQEVEVHYCVNLFKLLPFLIIIQEQKGKKIYKKVLPCFLFYYFFIHNRIYLLNHLSLTSLKGKKEREKRWENIYLSNPIPYSRWKE